MAQHCGYVIEVKNLRKHPNADRLQLLDVFGTTTTVSLDVKVGDIGIYFPTDLQLSVDYCVVNHLCHKNPIDGTADSGYMDGNKRNVTAIRLRGERSDGIYMPISSLASFGDIDKLKVGDQIDVFNGKEICCKYIPRSNKKSAAAGVANLKAKQKKAPIAPLFAEHADTSQLAYNLAAFKPGDEIEITLKIHGTSQRTGYLPVLQGYSDSWPCRVGNSIRHIMNKLDGGHREDKHDGKPLYNWGYVSGTRRTILNDWEGGFYGSNAFRKQHADKFEGKLWKGESVYYEVCGFTDEGASIMPSAANKKLKDKEFIKQYGETTVFSYGCEPHPETWIPHDHCELEPKRPQSDIYVYRMTMTNPDGEVVEYTPDFMRYRCEQMGVKCVPVFTKFILHDYDLETDTRTPGEIVMDIAEKYYAGPDPIGKTHTREGVVVRIINRPKFTAYKLKNFEFKCLEGLVKAEADAPDMEESQEVENG